MSPRSPSGVAPGATDPQDQPTAGRSTRPSGAKRIFNEAAHKLGYVPVEEAAQPKEIGPSETIKAAADQERDVVAHAGRVVLGLGALGVVFGDLGTSPLYTEQTIFQQHADAAHPSVAGVYGIASLIFWALLLEPSLKYAWMIMRAHNRGDGGVMALGALLQRRNAPRAAALLTIGLVGAGLFLGDGMVTPAISVTSAVSGLEVAAPSLSHLVVPISLGILVTLFAVQRFGTGAVGWMFGPVILLFFAVIGVLGAQEVVQHPGVIQGLSPVYGVQFIVRHGVDGWLTLGGVVLCVTGAEALYADRGHFGAGPIRLTWFSVVLPAVLLSYLGQSALILDHPASVHGKHFNPFYQLVPAWGQLPMVFLATAATIIASQAALTGSFSVAKQAVQLGFLPRLKIRHTSELEGQIYVPLINWLLCAGVVGLVLVFRSSGRLADIYGVAVTGTFLCDTTLFLAVARSLWGLSWPKVIGMGGVFYTVEVAFFSSNLTKVTHGAWLPLLVGLTTAAVMVTWRRGRDILTRNRTDSEGPLTAFLEGLKQVQPPIVRLPGTAVFLNPSKTTTPLAMRAQVEHSHALHQHVLMVSMEPVGIPHVDRTDRFVCEKLGSGLFKVTHLTVHIGYHDPQNVPAALVMARKHGFLDRNFDLEHAHYFVSRMTIMQTTAPGMAGWRKKLFITMARNSASPIDQFRLPPHRTVMTGSQVEL
ncbi:MAG: potassium transporter Kup [Solirubrobacteraceae bacterium]